MGTVGGLRSWGKHICCAVADIQGAVRKSDETRMELFLAATGLSAAKAATMAQFLYSFNELDRKPQVLDELSSQAARGPVHARIPSVKRRAKFSAQPSA